MHEKISTSHESHNEDYLCVRLERVMKIHKEGTLSLVKWIMIGVNHLLLSKCLSLALYF